MKWHCVTQTDLQSLVETRCLNKHFIVSLYLYGITGSLQVHQPPINISALALKTFIRQSNSSEIHSIRTYPLCFNLALRLVEALTQLIDPGIQGLQLCLGRLGLLLPVSTEKAKYELEQR
jgi:hypothetical protein